MGYSARKRESQDLNPGHPAPEHETHSLPATWHVLFRFYNIYFFLQREA